MKVRNAYAHADILMSHAHAYAISVAHNHEASRPTFAPLLVVVQVPVGLSISDPLFMSGQILDKTTSTSYRQEAMKVRTHGFWPALIACSSYRAYHIIGG